MIVYLLWMGLRVPVFSIIFMWVPVLTLQAAWWKQKSPTAKVPLKKTAISGNIFIAFIGSMLHLTATSPQFATTSIVLAVMNIIMLLRRTSPQDLAMCVDLFTPKDFTHIKASDQRGPEMIPFFYNAGQDIRKKAHGYSDFKIAFYLVALGCYTETLLSLIWTVLEQTPFELLLGKPLTFFAAGILFTYLGRNLHHRIEMETQISRLVAVQGNEDTARQLIKLEQRSGEVGRAERHWWEGYIDRHTDKIEKLRKDVHDILSNKYQFKSDILLKIDKPTKAGIPPAAYWLFTGKSAEEIADALHRYIVPDKKPNYVYTIEQ